MMTAGVLVAAVVVVVDVVLHDADGTLHSIVQQLAMFVTYEIVSVVLPMHLHLVVPYSLQLEYRILRLPSSVESSRH